MTPTAAKKFLKDNDVKFVLAQFVDIHGAAKAKAVPVEHLDMVLERRRGLRRLRALGLRHGAARSRLHGGRRPRDAVAAAVDAGLRAHRLRRPRAAASPGLLLARGAEARSSTSSPQKGLTLYTGIEPEFMLLDARRRRHARAVRRHRHARQALLRLQGPVARQRRSWTSWSTSLRAVGLDVYQIDHEDANGQFEVNFTYADALTTADNYILFKMAASEIARQHGHDRHVHAQAVLQPHRQRRALPHLDRRREARRTCSTTTSDTRGLGLSEMAYHFLGGLLAACARARPRSARRRSTRTSAWWSAARCPAPPGRRPTSPTATTTARLRAHSRRPARAAPAGRLAAIPTSRPRRSSRPAWTASQRKLDPGEPNNINLYEWTPRAAAEAGIGVLPQNLHEALDALEARRRWCATALGEELAAGVHRAEADGMDRVLAACLRLGDASATWSSSEEDAACAESLDCWSRSPRCATGSAS